MLLFAHKLISCWCLHTNLTLKTNLIFSTPPPPQEFIGEDVSVPRSYIKFTNGWKFISDKVTVKKAVVA